MKQKPMLFHKLMSQGTGRSREVIGLIGTHHGTGVTHTGLMLAFHLGEELGKKTAFLECNTHHDFALLQEAYQWSSVEAGAFSFHQITCRKDVNTELLPIVLGSNYECLILDFGTDYTANKDEFLRCNTKIIVGGKAPWEQTKLLRLAKATAAVAGSDSWLYFIPQADDKTINTLSKEIGRRVWSVPWTLEPTRPSKSSYQFLQRFFQE